MALDRIDSQVKPVDEQISLDESYGSFPEIEEEFQRFLDLSLDPRGPDAIFDLLASELPAGAASAVDVGCGDGRHSVRLAERFGLQVVAVDPVPSQFAGDTAQRALATGRVTFTAGRAEALPLPDESADVIWCAEALMYADLDAALREFARVLRPEGVALVYQVFTGPGMSEPEAAAFWEPEARSVRPQDVEAAIRSVGLELRRRVDFGSEFGERAQERDGAGGRRLIHVSRLLRDPDRYISKFGRANYQIMLGDCLWHVYRMIGKLHAAAILFSHPRPTRA